MKKTIKILSVFLTVVMFCSVFSVANPVLAAEVEEITETTLETENIENSDEENTENTSEDSEESPEVICEIEELRTEYTKYFRLSNGSYMAAQYAQPVHYEENGEWKEYDYSITENKNSDEKEFVIENSDSEMSFPEEFKEDDSAQIEVSAGDYEIKFSPVVENKIFKNSKGKVKDHKNLKSNKITEEFTEEAPIGQSVDKNSEKLKIDNQKSAIAYEEVYDNVDLEYEISSNQIKESIVLNNKQNKNKFEYTVDTDGLYPKKESDGSITLYEDKEYSKAVSSIATPYMYDANGVVSYDVTMDIKEKNGVYTLTVEASNNWLNDKTRVYPVVIDPTIILDVGRAKTYDCYVDDSQASTSFPYDYYIYAGHSSSGKTRTFIKFDLPDLPDNCAIIENASIRFWQKSIDMGDGSAGYLNIHNVTTAWENDRTVTWSKKPSYDGKVLDYCQFKSGAGAEYTFDITKSVKSWYEGEANYGLMLKSADESKTKRAQLYSAENTSANAYPVIQITYRNNIGLESYWSYSTYSIDTAGTAYINDYTGNLVYEMPLLSSISEIMPLTLTAIYNNYWANVKLNVGKNKSSRTTVSKGFRLNIQETVLPSTEYGLTGDAEKNYPYVYTDGDGTEHYIQKTTDDNGKTVYKDEDGLGLTLTLNHDDCTYKLTDKTDNIRCFNAKGNLIKIADANGNDIYVYYKAANSDIGLEAKSRISYITDGAGHKYTFEYYITDGVENDYIKTITDNAGRVITFGTSSGLLRYVKYSDGTKTSIVYEAENPDTYEAEEASEGLINYVCSNDGYALNFDYTSKATGRRVKTVKEYGAKNAELTAFSKGQVVTFDRTQYNTTVIRSAGIDGIHNVDNAGNGADDIVTTLQFDNSGRTVSQQLKYGSDSEIGAGAYAYSSDTDDVSTLGSKNKVSAAGALGKNVANLLSGGNAESTDGWALAATSDTALTTEKYATSNHYYVGKKGLGIHNTAINTSGANSYFRQKVTGLTVGNNYTLSAYVKTASLSKVYESTRTGAYIQITAWNDSGEIQTVYSPVLDSTTDTSIDKGWRRLTATLNIPKNTTYVMVYLCFRNSTGYAYFDCIQLEAGETANDYNMLENSSFEKYSSGLPTGWNAINTSYSTDSSGTVTNGITTEKKRNGSKSLCISGEPDTAKGFSQTVAVEGNASDTYIVGGWAMGYPVNSTYHTIGSGDNIEDKALFEIGIRVNYTCTDKSGNTSTVSQYKESAKFNTTITDWQYSSAPVVLKYTDGEKDCTYTPTSITIIPRYNYQVNYVYFDHLMLSKEPAQTYTYDKKGNLVSTAANSEQKLNMDYDDNNNLISYTDTLGNTTKASYDNLHNLNFIKSEKGVFNEYLYDEYGNVIGSRIRNNMQSIDPGEKETDLAIETGLEYFDSSASYGVDAGINAGAYLRYSYDEHGNATHYNYTWATGAQLSTTDANGNKTSYSYYGKDKYGNPTYEKLATVTNGSSTVTYTYDTTFSGTYGGNRISSILFSGLSGSPKENYSFKYDVYGNITQTKVGSQVLSTNKYKDYNGLLELTTYGNGDTISYGYNKLGNVNKIVKIGDSTTTYTWSYDSDGTPLIHKDSATGYKYDYTYDSLGRLVRQNVTSFAEETNGDFISYTENAYDERNNLVKVINNIGGKTVTQKYSYSAYTKKDADGKVIENNSASYAKDNLATLYEISSSRYVTYDYDSLNRLNQRKLTTDTPLYSNYTYKLSNRNDENETTYRTTQLSTEFIANDTYTYYYDDVGNITSIKKGVRKSADPKSDDFKTVSNASAYRSYEYDGLNQLTRENNASKNKSNVWRYDALGNIESVLTYDYTSGNLGEIKTGIDYQYTNDGKSGWNKLLTTLVYKEYSYDEDGKRKDKVIDTKTITYDEIGNPVKYLGASLKWTGRELYRYQTNSLINNYYYDADGLRSRKNIYNIVNGSSVYAGKTMYQYIGDQLAYQCTYDAKGNETQKLYFFYDSNGYLTAINYVKGSSNLYFYVTTNLQGDVLGIYSGSGTLLASYEYDAWGNCTITKDTDGIAALNPIRYRGYYYDTETGLYYLQSRYYNPEVGRFLNSDSISDSNAGVLGYNLFVYCGNNPVNCSDPTGHSALRDIVSLHIKTAVSYAQSLFKSITLNVGYGIGVGAKAKVTTSSGVSVGMDTSAKAIDSIGLFDGKLDYRTQLSVSANVEVASAINIGPESGYQHSLKDSNCTCNWREDPFIDRYKCPASIKYSEVPVSVGFSIGVYLGIGGEINVGIDIIDLANEWDEIASDYVKSLNEMRVFND